MRHARQHSFTNPYALLEFPYASRKALGFKTSRTNRNDGRGCNMLALIITQSLWLTMTAVGLFIVLVGGVHKKKAARASLAADSLPRLRSWGIQKNTGDHL